jgi:hypothetical protein
MGNFFLVTISLKVQRRKPFGPKLSEENRERKNVVFAILPESENNQAFAIV